MSNITVTTVSSKSDLNKFIKMQWKFYEGNPNWVPPLIMDRKHILDKKKHPFYKNAETELYIAWKDGEPVGRIAAIKNDMHNKVHNENIGFFGFFESINDQEVASALFQEAEKWIKARGLEAMRGPANPSSNEDWGLLVDGFDDPPRIMMTYNPEYYVSLLENQGLKKLKDLYAWNIENAKISQSKKLWRMENLVKERYNFKVRGLNMKKFKDELQLVKEVYNQAWAPNWGFIPMSEEEIDDMAANLKPLIVPEIVLFGEIEDKVVGFALVVPDYNYLFKEMNGRLFPFGIFKLLFNKRKIPRSRIITLGVIPEYQKKGLDSVFYAEITRRCHDIGIDFGEASWVLEDNDMMNRGAEMMNAEKYKTYRIYEKPV